MMYPVFSEGTSIMTRPALLFALGILSAVFLLSLHAHGQEASHASSQANDHSHGEGGVHDEIHHAMEAGEEFEAQPRSRSFLMWVIHALGWKYVLLLPASALLSFVLTLLLVIAGKGRTTGAALGFIVAIPFLLGLLGMFEGMMASFAVIASSTSAPKPSQVAEGISTSIVTPLAGMVLMAPSYLFATVGLSIRALKGESKS
jgi:hypothetical protein